jgi:hypothetical protein
MINKWSSLNDKRVPVKEEMKGNGVLEMNNTGQSWYVF